MNFSLYLFGNPNGYDQCPLDANNAKFNNELALCRTESRLSIYRDNQLIQYVYVRKVPGSTGLCLGFTLVFTGTYCLNCHSLNELFDKAFYDVLLKGELLRFQKEKYSYKVSKFVDNPNEVKRVNQYFKTIIDDELSGLFVPIPYTFQNGNGETTLSLKESTSNINNAISQYDIVHLTNDEKSVSELERTQQMLSALYAEHGELQQKYRKVLSQKRNFKVVVFLSLILLGCVTGFWLLNDVLNDKNVKINELEENVKDQSAMIVNLEDDKQTLNDSLHSLKRVVNVKENELQTLRNENSTLQNRVNSLDEEVGMLNTDIRLAREQLRDNQRTIQNLKKTNSSNSGERYKVWSSSGNTADIYYQYGTDFGKTSYQVRDNTEITVYHIQNGYAMTSVGYLRTKDIKKL